MADVLPKSQRQLVALSQLSLAGCTSTEPASVWPAKNIISNSLTDVKIRFTMLFSVPYELLGRRLVLHHAEIESILLGHKVYRLA